MEENRKLVTLKNIDSITPIPDADAIEAVHIGGWTAVVRKGEFYEGQSVFYFETDSMLPLDKEPFAFLRDRGVKEKDGIEYHRLKVMKLRGVMSDGLVMPTSIINYFVPAERVQDTVDQINEQGGNFTDLFEVVKYEDPILAKLGGKMKRFPDWITKTDEERVQNLPNLIKQIIEDNSFDDWYATEKIDGTSCTIWCKINDKGVFEYGVCSRNYGLEEEEDNTYWKIAKTPSITYNGELFSPLDYLMVKCVEVARSFSGTNTPSFVLQGEVFGEGIQNNPLGIKGQEIRFFNLFQDGVYVTADEIESGYRELLSRWVPTHPVSLESSMERIIAQPDGVKTLVPNANKNAQIEGFVWRNKKVYDLKIQKKKSADDIDWSSIPEEKWDLVKQSLEERTRASFKALSDKYRLKHQG